jgi:hypothetical protein
VARRANRSADAHCDGRGWRHLDRRCVIGTGPPGGRGIASAPAGRTRPDLPRVKSGGTAAPAGPGTPGIGGAMPPGLPPALAGDRLQLGNDVTAHGDRADLVQRL